MRNVLLTGLLTLLLAASAMAQLPGGITILPATADGSTGTFGFRELRANGTSATGFRAPTSLAADVYYTLPSADGSSGECLSTNGSGTLSWASCSGGGSSYYQTVRTFGGVDLTQRSVLRIASPAISVYDDAGGAETEMTLATSPAIAAVLVGTGRTLTTTAPLTIAGSTSADLSADRTLACPTCMRTDATNVPTADSTYSIGNDSFRLDDVWTDDVYAQRMILQRPGSAFMGLIEALPTDVTVFDAAGSSVLSWATTYLRAHRTLTPIGSIDVGGSSAPFNWVYANNMQVNTELLPDVDGGATLGNASKQFDAHLEDVTLYSDIIPTTTLASALGSTATLFNGVFAASYIAGRASVTTGTLDFYRATGSGSASLQGATYSSATAIEADALAISSSGSFYIRTYTGADVNCTSVSDGWIGYRLDTNELQICDGGAMVAK